MRPRNARTRWLIVVALAAPGCLFRPIFHPPSNQGDDAAIDSARMNDAAAASDAVAFDASAPDTAMPPPDDCRDSFNPATGMYYPDARHEDGALCELPTTDGGGIDASSDVPVADVVEVDAADDASDTGSDDATDDAAGDDAGDDAAVDDASVDDASSDDATADDAGDDAATDDAGDDAATDDATDPDV